MRATIAARMTSWNHDTDSEKWNTACIPKEGEREGDSEGDGESEGTAGINVRLAVGGGEHEGEK